MAPPNTKSKKNKRKKSFARAFKLDIGREKEVISEKWEVQTGKSLLMNSVRRKVIKYLCEYPCSSLSILAHDLKISAPSMSWHLKLLLERKLLSEKRFGGKRLFYPRNMFDNSAIGVLSILANPKINDIYLKINEYPGINQKELSKQLSVSHQSINAFTNRLKSVEVINIVRDGKFTRYYPSKKLGELEISQRKNLKEFRNWIIKAFKFDGVNPKLIRSTDRLLFLKITSGTNVESIRLSVNPFYSVIQNKKLFLANL